MNEELKQHISILDRSTEEQKRAVRKREKDLDQMKNDYEYNLKSITALNQKVLIPFPFLFLERFASLLVHPAGGRTERSSFRKRFIE